MSRGLLLYSVGTYFAQSWGRGGAARRERQGYWIGAGVLEGVWDPTVGNLEGGQPSTRCPEMKAGNKQGMLGTLVVSSRWATCQRVPAEDGESQMGKQATFLLGRPHHLLLNPAAGPEFSP